MNPAGHAPARADGLDGDDSVRETLSILARAQAIADEVRTEAEHHAAQART